MTGIKHQEEGKTQKVSTESKMHHRKPKKDSFYYIIYGVFIVIVIFLILAFGPKFLHKESEDNYNYHGFEFVKANNMYQTQIQLQGQEENLYTLEFRYGPRELEDVPIIGEPNYFLRPDALYVAFDATDEDLSTLGVASADIQMNLARVLRKKLVAACTNNKSADCVGIPIKNCTNTLSPVIIVRHDPMVSVEQNGSCLIVQGPGLNVTKAANRLVYYFYGIMDKE